MADVRLLGGAQAQLSRGDLLASKGRMGDVYGPGGGFKDSPLAGSMLRMKDNLFVDKATVGQPQTPVLTDDMAVKSIAIISVESETAPAVFVPDPYGGSPGGGDGGGGDGGGPGDGGDGGGAGDGGDGGGE